MEPSDRLISRILLLGVLYIAWRVSIGGQVDGDRDALEVATLGAIVTWAAILVVGRAVGRSRPD